MLKLVCRMRSQISKKLMKQKGIKKTASWSWVEMDGRVHVFLVGDMLHPKSHDVYVILEQLSLEIKEAQSVRQEIEMTSNTFAVTRNGSFCLHHCSSHKQRLKEELQVRNTLMVWCKVKVARKEHNQREVHHCGAKGFDLLSLFIHEYFLTFVNAQPQQCLKAR
ncbi:hypothetical protein Cgig2_020331 [Carnegiea gigantea]|uniref:Uncharacterized protein n=1 Tax=Carnegiea gigantea TaxID=171969 RepID=A0A9Q1KDN7_9CARY|nr:hypothetical protein Cgig2_020331 [Carnegiea gigantea]